MIFQASFYKSKKLLLIEDCEPVRASIKGMLQQIGFEDITTAADALQAVASIKKNSFDFILADFDLGSGQDALQLNTDLSQHMLVKAGCCFVLMSAEPRRLPVLGLLRGAPDAFILKPFSYLELEKRLAKVWNHRLKLRKVYQALLDNDYQTAQAELDQVINAKNAASLPALRLMGEVLLREGNYNAAQKLYEQVLQQRDFSWSRLGHAVSLLQQQDYSAAEPLLQAMLDVDEIRPEALEWLSCLYLRQGEFDTARQQLTELLKLQPNHIDAHLATVTALEQSGSDNDAIKHLQKLVQQYRFSSFDRADFYFALCRFYLKQAQQGDLSGLSAVLKKATDALSSLPNKLQSEQTETVIALLRARCSVLQGHYADGKRQLEQVPARLIATDPALLLDCASLAFALGEVKLSEQYIAELKAYDVICGDLSDCCRKILAQDSPDKLQQQRADIRQWNQTGMELLQQGDAASGLLQLLKAFMYMPCNASLVLNVLQALSELKADKKWLVLAKNAMNALEFSSKTSANQQRLAELLNKLPALYLD